MGRLKAGFKKVVRKFERVNDFLYKYRKYLVVAYLILSIIFFIIQFNLINNWDMLVRILNGNYLFHNGQYFEYQRALLESTVIGLLAFAFGSYAVYAFIALFSVIFFIALLLFSRAFKVEYVLLLGIVLNPFLLYYGIKNGSEIPLYAFLILFVSMIKLKRPIAGMFFALAFVSKYDAVMFLPLALFLIDKRILESLKRIGLFIGILLVSLLPFFAYNLILYHNPLFTFEFAFSQSSAQNLILGPGMTNIANVYGGFLELVVFVPIVAFILLFNRDVLKEIKQRKRELALLAAAAAIALVIYLMASGLYVGGLGYFRFFLGPTLFLSLLSALFLKRGALLFTLIFFAISILLAYNILYAQQFGTPTMQIEVSSARSLLYATYNTTNCTVQSNNWVYLDYHGISATYIWGVNYSQYPIISFGALAGNYSLLGQSNGIYLYGYGASKRYCSYTPVIDFKYGVNFAINASRANNTVGCYLAYNRLSSTLLLDACKFLASITR